MATAQITETDTRNPRANSLLTSDAAARLVATETAIASKENVTIPYVASLSL